MRVLHVADRLSPRGGAYQHLLGLLAQQAGVHQVALAVGRLEAGTQAPCPVHLVAGLDAREAAPAALDELAARLRPDLVHLHTVVNPVALEWAAAQDAVITVQDHRYFCPGRGKWTADGEVCLERASPDRCRGCFDDAAYFAGIEALTRRRLAALRGLRVVVLSRYMRQELAQTGVEAAQVTVVPPFVHDLPAAAEPSEPCVLFVGRLVAAKGVLEAVAAWRRSGLRLPLLLAGTGPLREEAGRQGARVLGWVDRGRLARLYAGARVLVMPSRWQEPFGIAGLEALRAGLPVAAWRSGGIPEWHPGGPGLVPWGDVEALAGALRDLAAARWEPREPFPAAAAMAALEEVYASGRGQLA